MPRKFRDISSPVELPPLNITSFLNLMVVLIPFLLLTAVFNQVSAIDLQIGSASDEKVEKESLPLEIFVDQGSIRIRGGNRWRSSFDIEKNDNQAWQTALSDMGDILREIKNLHPEEKNIRVSFSPLVDYQRVVDVLRVTRGRMVNQDGVRYRMELFPGISVSLIEEGRATAM